MRRKLQQRTCIGCRRKAEQAQLLRLVRSNDGELLVDHPHRLGGRGAYVCSSLSCLSRALRSPRLGKSVGGAVTLPELSVMTGQIRERLSSRVQGLLAAAGRAGHAALGASRAEAVLREKRCGGSGLVVLARDASPRVRRDLTGAAQEAGVTLMEFGDRDRLGMAFARSELGALVLTDAGLAKAVRHELALLQGLSTTEKEEPPSKGEDKALERAT